MEQTSPERLKLALRILLIVGMPISFALVADHFVSQANLYALMQSFAFLGLLTLGLSVTMIAGEFDLSVAAVATVAGLITVKFGGDSALFGIGCAVVFGIAVGVANAALLPWLQVSSLVTTVGSMILLTGVAFWLAGGRVLSYDNFEVSDFLDQNVAGIFSVRSLITLACYILVAGLLYFTRVGREIYAAGGHRKAAIQSGARVGAALTVSFMISGGALGPRRISAVSQSCDCIGDAERKCSSSGGLSGHRWRRRTQRRDRDALWCGCRCADPRHSEQRLRSSQRLVDANPSG